MLYPLKKVKLYQGMIIQISCAIYVRVLRSTERIGTFLTNSYPFSLKMKRIDSYYFFLTTFITIMIAFVLLEYENIFENIDFIFPESYKCPRRLLYWQ